MGAGLMAPRFFNSEGMSMLRRMVVPLLFGLVGAAILALFLRGDDKAAQSNAKWVALATTVFAFVVSLNLQTKRDVIQHIQPGQQGVFLEDHRAICAGAGDDPSVQ